MDNLSRKAILYSRHLAIALEEETYKKAMLFSVPVVVDKEQGHPLDKKHLSLSPGIKPRKTEKLFPLEALKLF